VTGSVAPADIGVGTRLGKYEIIKRLATGGMAEIFLARVSGLPGFQKMVVIKRILPQLASNNDFVEMFLDEARIAATLQHPNVVQMYDVGVVDGNYFIAMEYLHGEDVRSMMKVLNKAEKKLPLEHALNIVIGVASALHYAHEKVGFDGMKLDIVHRDVTPQNIIVTYDGAVKLLDFGIAKASNRFGETRFGTLKGKVPYMSPEQCRGEALDRRSDIFSLGIMLYELTLGRRLFRGKSDFELLKQIVEGTVERPSELDPTYAPALEAIVMRTLEKEKDKRYQTARELQAELEALVRADRVIVSPIALQQYMEELFGQKIEAWREAQAQGKTLGEHLEEQQPVEIHDDDLEEVGETEAREAERAAAERAAFRARIEATPAGGMRRAPPQRRPLALLLAGALVVAAAGVTLVVRHAHKPPPLVQAPAITRPEPVAVLPPLTAPPPATPMGIIKIATTPPGATLFLDGKRLDAVSPVTVDAIAAGKSHVLLASLPGFWDALTSFTLVDNEVRPITIKLRESAHHVRRPIAQLKPKLIAPTTTASSPSPPPVALDGEGTLLLASSPWCNVSIDGVNKGPTPVSVKLRAGKHNVVLSNPEFKIARTLPVLILPNQTLRKRLDFN
jgi:tRNA A-37 threonylcarbamoyl transferase component Bud32